MQFSQNLVAAACRSRRKLTHMGGRGWRGLTTFGVGHYFTLERLSIFVFLTSIEYLAFPICSSGRAAEFACLGRRGREGTRGRGLAIQ